MKKRIALFIAQIALAAIFLVAGFIKAREPWLQFAVSITTFKLVPLEWVEPLARTLPWIELALGAWLLSGIWLRWSALAATLMLGFFFAVLIRSYALGIQVDCGCFGSGETLGPKRLAEEAGMFGLALGVTIAAFRRRATRRHALT